MPQTHPPHHLWDFIAAHRREILSRWEKEVRAASATPALPRLALRDHIPTLLTRLSRAGEAAYTGEALPLASFPDFHALDRLDRGFDLQEVVTEYTTLRRCILALWEERGGATLAAGEIRRLDQILDEAITTSVKRYASARERTLRALDRISEAALGSGDLDAFLKRLLTATQETMENVDVVAIFLREGDKLRMRATIGLEDNDTGGFTLQIGEGFTGSIAAERRPRHLQRASEDLLIQSQTLRKKGIRALYGVPLSFDGDTLIGVALMGSTSAEEFSPEDRLLFRSMASRATTLIVQAQLISQIQKSEEQLKLLIDGARDYAIFLLDSEGRIATWNKGAERLHGYQAEEILQKPFSLLFPEEEVARGAPEALLQAAVAGRIEGEGWRRRKDGSVFWAEGSLTALRDERGRLQGFVKVMRDATERRRAEEERARLLAQEQEARQEAQQAVQAREDFLAIVSHDLRNPLGAILLSAAYLQQVSMQDERGQRIQKHTQLIQRAAERMSRLINDLLDLSSIQAGHLSITQRPHTPQEIAEEAIETSMPAAQERGLDLKAEVEPGLPSISCDRDRILQALSNLLSNAIKVTQNGGDILLRVGRRDGEVLFSVKDTGPGIPEEALPRLFTRFWRVKKSRYQGTGLGLAITKGIVEAHGGKIWVESRLGRGSTFYFTVPLTRMEAR